MPALAIILTPEYADWEFAPIAALGKEFYGYNIQISSPNAEPVTSIAGLISTPLYNLENVKAENFDALVIIGGKIWESDNCPDMTPLILSFLSANKIVAGICGAPLALARAGILNERQHTSNNANFIEDYVSKYSGSNLYIDTDKAVNDHNIISASGFSPHQFAAEIFRATGMVEADVVDYLRSLSAEFK